MSTFVKKMKDQRGVTLIELLAVIVILGIIAAVAIPAIVNNFDKAKENSDLQTQNIVKDAALRYIIMEDPAFSGTPPALTITIATDLVGKGYLLEAPKWSNGINVANVTVTKNAATGQITFDPANLGNPTATPPSGSGG